MDPAQAPGAPVVNHAPGADPSALEKAFDSCKKAVNNHIPGSLKENASFEDKTKKVATLGTIGVVFVASGLATGGAVPLLAVTIGAGCVAYKAFEHAQQTHAAIASPPGPVNYTTSQINDWLFDRIPNTNFPPSKLVGREQDKYGPKVDFSKVPMLSQEGKYTSRIAVYQGSITDISALKGQKAAVGDSNNGDLLTGCGYAVAKAIINAAGPDLQKDLYNEFGTPGYMKTSAYGQSNYSHTEGRGYSITCDAHDMKETHNIEHVEFMTVPLDDVKGVFNMYKEAFEHSQDLDFIVLPMAGMSHPVLKDKPELSAQIATEEFKKFVEAHPESKLKVIFSIFEPEHVDTYTTAAKLL